jgi:YbgC/YbaW family acyl-CoA thioester hydrolase
MPPFRTTRRIEFCDTDMAGIVHFANFFRFMESAEVEFLRARGLSVKMEWEGRVLGFPRVAASCDYVKPVHFEEILDVSVVIDRIGAKSVTFAFEFLHKGEVVARGKVTSVCCLIGPDDRFEGTEIPETYRKRLES